MADVAVHLHQRALVVGERVRLAERAARAAAPPSARPRRARPPCPPPSPVRRGRTCSRTSRPDASSAARPDACGYGSSAVLEALPAVAWWQVTQRSARPQVGDPDLLQRRPARSRAFSAPNFSATCCGTRLVVAPVVRAVAREEHGDEHEQHADDGQHRPIDARVRRVGAAVLMSDPRRIVRPRLPRPVELPVRARAVTCRRGSARG